MRDHLIKPRRAFWQWWKDNVSPQVNAALIGGAVAIGLAVVPAALVWRENSALKKELSSKTAKIQELEFELTPFRTLALERFSKADPQALKQLAEQMTALQSEYAKQLDLIASLKAQLDDLRKASTRTDLTLRQLQRTIPPETRTELVNLLKTLPKANVEVLCYASDSPEALHFSKELQALFIECDFNATLNTTIYMHNGTFGEFVRINSLEYHPRCADAIIPLLRSCGLAFTVVTNKAIPTNSLQFVVADRRP
jgi:hypothetical protein